VLARLALHFGQHLERRRLRTPPGLAVHAAHDRPDSSGPASFLGLEPVLVREAAACEAREYNPAHRINPAYDCATIAQRLQDAQRAATGQPPVATADEGEPAPDATTVAAGTAPAFLTP
jgi:hypothetical protein